MRSAWVCACDAVAGAAVVAHLTELGYTPRRAASTAPASAVADLSDGAEPEVAIVTAAAGTARAALAVVAALRAAPALDGLAIVLVLDPAALEDAPTAPEADEVMIAPGTAAELRWRIARTRAEPGVAGDGDIVALDGLVLNLATYETTVDGRLVELTHMEHRLLRFLATHPGRVFTREALLERVWGHAVYGATRTVDVHVRRIRAKLGPEHGQRIQTVRSVGYRLEA